jgi:hypothetical protein
MKKSDTVSPGKAIPHPPIHIMQVYLRPARTIREPSSFTSPSRVGLSIAPAMVLGGVHRTIACCTASWRLSYPPRPAALPWVVIAWEKLRDVLKPPDAFLP